MDRISFERASEFVWRHARLLDRRRFAHLFLEADPDGVAAAVLAYRRPDGGFGDALEADCRTPHSVPEATRIALNLLAGVDRLTSNVAGGAVKWLASVTTPEGGVPFCLPTAVGFPRAPWWEPEGDPNPPNVNPTAGLVGVLRSSGVDDPWVDRAEAWCLSEVERLLDGPGLNQYEVPCMVDLCTTLRDGVEAVKLMARISDLVSGGSVVPLDPDEKRGDDTHTPLQLAPSPSHPLRPAFSDEVVTAFLDRLEREQQDDGGWAIHWAAPGETAVWEWRGAKTVDALATLKAYGRLL